MGNYDDLYYEISVKLNELNLKKEFDNQLTKMNYQEKHRYKPFRDKYEYAFARVTKGFLPYNSN